MSAILCEMLTHVGVDDLLKSLCCAGAVVRPSRRALSGLLLYRPRAAPCSTNTADASCHLSMPLSMACWASIARQYQVASIIWQPSICCCCTVVCAIPLTPLGAMGLCEPSRPDRRTFLHYLIEIHQRSISMHMKPAPVGVCFCGGDYVKTDEVRTISSLLSSPFTRMSATNSQ